MTDKLKQLIEDNKEVTFRCVPAGSGKGEFVIKTSSTFDVLTLIQTGDVKDSQLK